MELGIIVATCAVTLHTCHTLLEKQVEQSECSGFIRDDMTGARPARRNPSRRCRTKSTNDNDVDNVQSNSTTSSGEEHCGNDEHIAPADGPEDRSGSTPSEYEVLDQKRSADDDASSADFEGEEEVSVGSKRQAKRQASGRRQKQKTKRSVGRNATSLEDGACSLSEKQMRMLGRIFSELDTNKNGRISMSDILRAAEDYGLDYENDDARDMVRFWDSSGTGTISRETFTRLAIDSKFMVRASR